MQGRILIVEDDPAIRELLKAVLEAGGHEVFEVGDGLSAHPTARDVKPDVVLLDVGLPGIDGFAVLGLLKDDPELKHVPVIMVTAWAEPDLVVKAMDRGALDYIRKPFDISELSARVDAALRLKSETDFLAHDHQRLAEVAASDPLTGLPNRRQLEATLAREAMVSQRTGRPVSVLKIDLDGFEGVNDDLGHELGDEVLRAAAKRLRQRVRGADLIGRWAGEEFMVIAAGTDLGGAGVLAEDLRSALAGRPLDLPRVAVRITASFGVAELAPGERLEDVLARADAAVETVKAAGANAVRLGGAVDTNVLA